MLSSTTCIVYIYKRMKITYTLYNIGRIVSKPLIEELTPCQVLPFLNFLMFILGIVVLLL